jgi:arylsulfatase
MTACSSASGKATTSTSSPSSARRDWQLNHVGGVYGIMDEVFQFVATFKDFPPRSFPPSFNPANIMESTIDGFKEDRRLKQQLDLARIRGGLNKMIDQQLREHGR